MIATIEVVTLLLAVAVSVGAARPTADDLFGVDKAWIQGYSVEECTDHDPAKRPRWCIWSFQDTNTFTKVAASFADDAYEFIVANSVDVPFFTVPDTHNGMPLRSYPLSNGFLSMAPYAMCRWYCGGYTYAQHTSREGVLWPMISIYNVDLDPSQASGTGSGGVFSRNGVDSELGTITLFSQVPLFEPRAPRYLNLTALIAIYPNGTVLLLFKSIPPPPTTRHHLVPAVGLFFSELQRINVPAPTYIDTPPPEYNASAALPRMSVYGYRFDRLPREKTCSGLGNCSACVAAPNCTWCSGIAAPRGLCVNSLIVDDFCRTETRHSTNCARSDFALDAAAVSAADPGAGFYTSQYAFQADFSPTSYSLIDVTSVATIELPFRVPFFYNPKNGLVQTHPRMLSRAVISIKGTIQFTSSGGGGNVKAWVNVLASGLLAPLKVEVNGQSGSVGYTVLPQRPRTNSLCHSQTSSLCVQTLFVYYKRMSVVADVSVGQVFDFAVGVHEDGTVQLFYNFATSTYELDRDPSGITRQASLFTGDPQFQIGLVLNDEMGITRQHPISWTLLAGRQLWTISPIPSRLGCLNGGVCNRETLECDCGASSQFSGPQCERCRDGWYPVKDDASGASTALACAECPKCANGGWCNARTGQCDCAAPFSGPRCETRCRDGEVTECSDCNSTRGMCECGVCHCNSGFTGVNCATRVSDVVASLPMEMWNYVGLAVVSAAAIIVVVAIVYRRRLSLSQDAPSANGGGGGDGGGEDDRGGLSAALSAFEFPGAAVVRQPPPPNAHLMTPLRPRNPLLRIPAAIGSHDEKDDDEDDDDVVSIASSDAAIEAELAAAEQAAWRSVAAANHIGAARTAAGRTRSRESEFEMSLM